MTDEELDQRVRAAVLAEQIDAAPLEREGEGIAEQERKQFA